VVERIVREIEPLTSTRKIYRLARRYLNRLNHASGLRYSLKRALFRLGPSGYPFERYFGALLGNYGYEVSNGLLLEGRCVKHEVDVFAVNEQEVIVAECKYHNRPGGTTDVKVAMYVNSRFKDLEPVISSRYPDRKFSGMLVTNTRCTSDAIAYANCSHFHIKSWRYPEDSSLEKMIEEKRLYPVTIISGIKSGLAKKLVEKGIVLLKDLLEMDIDDLQRLLSISSGRASALKRQVESLCEGENQRLENKRRITKEIW
jgi:predicted RecB family endonuclease